MRTPVLTLAVLAALAASALPLTSAQEPREEPIAVGAALVTLIPQAAPPQCVPAEVPYCAGATAPGAAILYDSGGARPSWSITADGLQWYCNGRTGIGDIRQAVLGNSIGSFKRCGGDYTLVAVQNVAKPVFHAWMTSHTYFGQGFSMSSVVVAAPLPV